MKMDVIEQQDGITMLRLSGKLDIEGTLAVDPQFAELSKSKDKVIVDLEHVDFLASLGMRTLVSSAKSLMEKGGRLVLLNPQAGVEKAIKSAGLDTIIPIAPDLKSLRLHHSDNTSGTACRFGAGSLKVHSPIFRKRPKWADQLVSDQNVPSEKAYALQVCLEEILTNIVRHGGSDTVQIRLALAFFLNSSS